MKTTLKTDLKSKHFCSSNSYTLLGQKDISVIDFKFYQKIFVLFILLSTILIFPESPKDLESICMKYNTRELCNVW